MRTPNKIKLTKKTLDGMVPHTKRYTVYDTELAGFGVRVFPSGVQSYIIEYRGGGGGRSNDLKRMTLGKLGELT